jgi:hypothetical protein
MSDNLMGTKDSGNQPIMVFMGYKTVPRRAEGDRSEINRTFTATKSRNIYDEYAARIYDPSL